MVIFYNLKVSLLKTAQDFKSQDSNHHVHNFSMTVKLKEIPNYFLISQHSSETNVSVYVSKVKEMTNQADGDKNWTSSENVFLSLKTEDVEKKLL